MPAQTFEEVLLRINVRENLVRIICTIPGFQLDSTLDHFTNKIHTKLRNELRDFIGHQAQYFPKEMSHEIQLALVAFVDHLFKENECQALKPPKKAQ